MFTNIECPLFLGSFMLSIKFLFTSRYSMYFFTFLSKCGNYEVVRQLLCLNKLWEALESFSSLFCEVGWVVVVLRNLFSGKTMRLSVSYLPFKSVFLLASLVNGTDVLPIYLPLILLLELVKVLPRLDYELSKVFLL